MKEELLHYVWRTKRFDSNNLTSTTGEPIDIIHTGTHNKNAGPDFFNAKIKIGETFWAGNVEMHLKSSDWLRHKHQDDKAYNNVILHVVIEEDQPILTSGTCRIPCLELKNRIEPSLVKTYRKLLRNKLWIPCQTLIPLVDSSTKSLWIENLLIERIMAKTERINEVLEQNLIDWDDTFYQLLTRNFGLKVNADPFEAVARSLPLRILLKHKNSVFQIEALLFGQAGFLQGDFADDHPKKLKKEYSFLKRKYRLQPIKKENWKFSRLRPANFPTIRIAQLATLIYCSDNLFGKVLAAANVRELENMFEVKLSNYWQSHYQFDKPSGKKQKPLGKNTIHLFIINTIVPFLFLYGERKAEEKYKEKALEHLRQLKPEKNGLIRKWEQLGMHSDSAAQTQGLLQLKEHYCDQFKCLDCAIGHQMLKG